MINAGQGLKEGNNHRSHRCNALGQRQARVVLCALVLALTLVRHLVDEAHALAHAQAGIEIEGLQRRIGQRQTVAHEQREHAAHSRGETPTDQHTVRIGRRSADGPHLKLAMAPSHTKRNACMRSVAASRAAGSSGKRMVFSCTWNEKM